MAAPRARVDTLCIRDVVRTEADANVQNVIYEAESGCWGATAVGGKTVADLRPCGCAEMFDVGFVEFIDRVANAFVCSRYDGPADSSMHAGSFVCTFLLECAEEDCNTEDDDYVWVDSDGCRYHCYAWASRAKTCECGEGVSSSMKRGEHAVFKYGVNDVCNDSK